MAISPAARPYARALFELARDQQCMDFVMADLYQLVPLTERPDQYRELLGHRRLPDADRERLWRSILEAEAEPLTLRFVLFLLRKNRLTLLGEIIEEYSALYHAHLGALAVRIVSARPLPADQVKAITERMRARLGGSRIKAFLEVSPDLIGGFQVRVGDVVHDFSVKHQLDLLHRRVVTA